MRLIDADAFDKALANAQAECKKNGGNFRFGVLSNVRANIADAPTIDAIPVEWLEHMMTATTLTRTSNAIKDVLALWKRMGQQEQETRTEF